MADHLNYYNKIKLIPTVNLTDLDKKTLFTQRKNYYFNLGLTKNNFFDRSILELCAGTGYNAYFLKKQFKVKKIKLIDNNIESIKSAKKNLSKLNNVKILNKNINNFKTKEKFDYVIMENALDNFSNEKIIIKKILDLTKKDGNIILTLGDNYGIFSNKLRYVFSLILIEQSKIINFKDKINFLSNIFSEHLNYLSTNTRKVDKWVLDNILNSEWIRKKNYINHAYLIKFIKNKAVIQNISPSFCKRFDWYKTLNPKTLNNKYLKSYLNERINFLDFETSFNKKLNIDKNLKQIFIIINQLVPDKVLNKKLLNDLETELKKLVLKLKKLNRKNKVVLTIEEFILILQNYKLKKKINIKTKYLKKFWGIYTQHVLLYKY